VRGLLREIVGVNAAAAVEAPDQGLVVRIGAEVSAGDGINASGAPRSHFRRINEDDSLVEFRLDGDGDADGMQQRSGPLACGGDYDWGLKLRGGRSDACNSAV
jgi:hypothetical protein